jgi:hypothetical protein
MMSTNLSSRSARSDFPDDIGGRVFLGRAGPFTSAPECANEAATSWVIIPPGAQSQVNRPPCRGSPCCCSRSLLTWRDGTRQAASRNRIALVRV